MLRNIIATILLACGALGIAGGILAYTVRQNVLTPAIYISAFQDANLYENTTAIIEYKAADLLITAQQALLNSLLERLQSNFETPAFVQQTLLVLINQAITQETQKIVETISNNIQLNKTIQNTSESGITFFIGWLKGEQPDPVFFKYIPTPEQITAVRQEGIASFLLESSPLQIATGSGVISNQVENSINGFLNQYQLSDIVNSVFDFATVVSQNVQNLYALRTFVQESLAWTYWGFAAGTISLMLGVIVTSWNRVRTLLITLLATGAVLAANAYGSVLYLTTTIQTILPKPTEMTGLTDIPVQLRLNFIDSINAAAQYIIYNVFATALYVGLAIAGIALLLLIGAIMVPLLVPRARRVIFREDKKQAAIIDKSATTPTAIKDKPAEAAQSVVTPQPQKRRGRRKQRSN
jgi:hypothetical protein